MQQPQLFEGVRNALQQVVQNGGQNYLLTHRNNSAMEFITQDGIKSLFTDFITAEQPFPRKPNPTSLNYLIDKHKVDRETAVMVGDRNLDIDAGHNAGIAGILFDPDDLIEVTSNPEIKIHSITEILND
ncbi:HAD-IA family hydrolase [Paucilactobacillus hokkaidonensis]|uniref:HAD-IA family hydrolase n=1 Tax=Paucilactobacillus hokkaidonensis TaxID=1193095 RepID=UPI0006D09044|nr:HAD-IA family hydrolase [Paucilactobacillus hokkaidonensis]